MSFNIENSLIEKIERIDDKLNISTNNNKIPININGKLINCERGDTVDFYWQQLKRWTGINKRFHSTRHTFATRASMNGWSITEISAQGGWKDLKVLKRYTHISAEHLAKKLRY